MSGIKYKGHFIDGVARALSSESKWGYVNRKGDWVVCPIYDQCFDFKDGVGITMKEDLYGLVDSAGREIVPPSYLDIEDYREGLAAVQDSGCLLWGFIDREGNVVVEPQYERVGFYSCGMAYVKDAKGMYGFIDKVGSVTVPIMYDDVQMFHEGYAWVKEPSDFGKYGLIGLDGEYVIPPSYTEAYNVRGGVAVARLGGWGLVDVAGRTLIPFIYGTLFEEDNSGCLLALNMNSERGYIDHHGFVVDGKDS